jgi:hypothetical protein
MVSSLCDQFPEPAARLAGEHRSRGNANVLLAPKKEPAEEAVPADGEPCCPLRSKIRRLEIFKI